MDNLSRATQIGSAFQPIEACAWCWYLLHPEQPYPERWSSTICAEHAAWFERLRAERRDRLTRRLEEAQS